MSSTTIDDTDPSISFDNGWWPTQNADAFMGSLMHTDTNGARATVSFEGTSIEVFGTIKEGTSSSYSVDNMPPEPFEVYPDTTHKQYRQLFYTSPELPNRNHTLVIENTSHFFQLVLDYMVIKSTPPSVSGTTTKVFVSSASMGKAISTTKTIPVSTTLVRTVSMPTKSASSTVSSKASSTRSTSSSVTTSLTPHPYSAPIPSTLPTSSPTIILSPNNTTTPSPVPGLESHDNQLSTAAIIGLAIGSFAAMASLLLLVYLGYRHKKQKKQYSTKPRPLPHMDSPTHAPPIHPSPSSPTLNHSPPFLSEKSQLYAFGETRDLGATPGAGGLGSDSDGRTDGVYSPQPGSQNEGGQDPMMVLSPLRYTEPLTPAPGPSSNLTGPDTFVGPARSESNATASPRMSLLPLQERVFSPSNEPGSPLEAVSTINAEASGSMGKSSAMGFPNSNSLHQRTTSLSISDGRTINYGGGGGGSDGRRDGAMSSFDELPPYPGTARWSRRYDI